MKWLSWALIVGGLALGAASGLMPWGTLAAGLVIVVWRVVWGARGAHTTPTRAVRLVLVAFFIVAMALSAIKFGIELRVLLLQAVLNVIWLMLCRCAWFDATRAGRMQLATVSVLPMACAAATLPVAILVPTLAAFDVVWVAFLRRESMAAPSTGGVATCQAPRADTWRAKDFWRAAALWAVVLLLSTGLFLILPRMDPVQSIVHHSTAAQSLQQVDLSRTGPIDLDRRLLFRAEVPATWRTGTVYWRLGAQNAFDGLRWHSQNRVLLTPPVLPADSRAVLYRVEFLRPWKANPIPLPSQTDVVPSSTDDRIQFYSDSADIHYRWGWGAPLMIYRFRERAPQPSPSPPLSSLWPFAASTRLPLSLVARAIAPDIASNEQKASRVMAFLRAHYQYSLDRPARHGTAVTDFLFYTPRGHCEMFSTSMAVLLSLLDVPVRNVTGFASGEFHNGLNYVRASHAHSWVEVYLDSARGWVRFDPTPPSVPARVPWHVRLSDRFAMYSPRALVRTDWPAAITPIREAFPWIVVALIACAAFVTLVIIAIQNPQAFCCRLRRRLRRTHHASLESSWMRATYGLPLDNATRFDLHVIALCYQPPVPMCRLRINFLTLWLYFKARS